MVEFEKPDYNITKEIFSNMEIFLNDEAFDKIQMKRDDFFINNQLIPLLNKYPEKTILVVRGEGHIDLLSKILRKHNIYFGVINYTTQERRKSLEKIREEEKKVATNLLKELHKELGMNSNDI